MAMKEFHHQDYKFTPVTAADLPMLRTWLEGSEVRKWWEDPEVEVNKIKNDMTHKEIDLWVVSFDDVPFAYIQDYNIHAWPVDYLEGLPLKTRGIDTFIGLPGMLHKGHGPNFIKILAEKLACEGTEQIIIDPNVNNIAARKAYAKVGFKEQKIVSLDDGDFVIMHFI